MSTRIRVEFDGISALLDGTISSRHVVEAVDFTRVWGAFRVAKKLPFRLHNTYFSEPFGLFNARHLVAGIPREKDQSDKVKPRLEADETDVRARVSAHSLVKSGGGCTERSQDGNSF